MFISKPTNLSVNQIKGYFYDLNNEKKLEESKRKDHFFKKELSSTKQCFLSKKV